MDIAAKLLHSDELVELIVGDCPGQQPADLCPDGVPVSSIDEFEVIPGQILSRPVGTAPPGRSPGFYFAFLWQRSPLAVCISLDPLEPTATEMIGP